MRITQRITPHLISPSPTPTFQNDGWKTGTSVSSPTTVLRLQPSHLGLETALVESKLDMLILDMMGFGANAVRL